MIAISFSKCLLSRVLKGVRKQVIGIIPECILEKGFFLVYELRFYSEPAFLSQAIRKKSGQSLLSQVLNALANRPVIYLITIVVLVLSDVFGKWSGKVAVVAGRHLLNALLEQALQILLPLMAFLIPLFMLAFNSLRDRLGSRFTDFVFPKLGLLRLLTTGIGLSVSLGVVLSLLPQTGVATGKSVFLEPLMRTGVWLLGACMVFLGNLVLWLWKMLRLLNTEQCFNFLWPLIAVNFRKWCQDQQCLNIAIEEMERFSRRIGVSLMPFSTSRLGHPTVVAKQFGWLRDVRLWRLKRTVSQLPAEVRAELAITVWPFHYVEKNTALVRAKECLTLDPHFVKRLSRCFVLSKSGRKPTRISGSMVFDLIKEQALLCAKRKNKYDLKKWFDAFSDLLKVAHKYGLSSLPDLAYFTLNSLVEELVAIGDKEGVSLLCHWLYKQTSVSYREDDEYAFGNYLQLLKWQFCCSLRTNNEHGAKQALYYLLLLGQDSIRTLEEKSDEENLKKCLKYFRKILNTMRQLLKCTLEKGAIDFTRDLYNESDDLIKFVKDALAFWYSDVGLWKII